jgi:hypothetical protein
MSNPPPPARPRPRPSSASGARQSAPGAPQFARQSAPGGPQSAPQSAFVGLQGESRTAAEYSAGAHRADAASRLPVSEFLFDRAGAPSPFGEDLQFPLPAGALTYRHAD